MTVHRTAHAGPFLFAGSDLWAEEDLEACRAAALFLAQHAPAPTFEKVSALFYLADRAHLSRYGALICGGTYEAMRHGPTPGPLLTLTRQGLDLTAGAAPDMEELSPAALEVMGEVLALYGEDAPEEVSARTRGEDWKTCPPGLPMTAAHIARTLPNARAVLEHLADPHP
ncbi:MAG: hypothetical protein Q4C89_01510 [Deinococcus sp.]|uniref:type II toxin-antitoxin system antitoxin SocA domain-containing protein n=1 Tax=Deinococcus sp. TaxID=47478 RepID=UPI0026DCA466|nr:type II toxin-antitoxin system antitoxin SocA domain-containing protein [Deinococcus sp.]MDO4244686.1 hypothetical protein [Deinococcus sp.]